MKKRAAEKDNKLHYTPEAIRRGILKNPTAVRANVDSQLRSRSARSVKRRSK